MNIFKPFLLLIAALLFVTGGAWSVPTRADIEREFRVWRDEFKVELASTADFFHRFHVFEQNHLNIWFHNVHGNHTYTLGHNQFSHLTSDEFGQLVKKGRAPLAPQVTTSKLLLTDAFTFTSTLPTAIDWVQQGAVTPVKDQGQCGSCWTFSATGALEGAHFVQSGKLVSMSEQQLVDCDKNSMGCNGGLMDSAFEYVQKQGLATEQAYGYKGADGVCAASTVGAGALALQAGQVTKIVDVPAGSEVALQAAVAQQPVSVAIQANQFGFQFYKSGVFTAACGHELDHGVLVVGYGVDEGSAKPYWKVKNSWGPGWGESGYIRLEKGINQCGIADSASYPVLSSR